METLTLPRKPTIPLPPRKLLITALSHAVRWEILKALCSGEALMVSELADIAGCSADMASKHLIMLRKAGLVVQGRAQLYSIQKAHQPLPGQPVLDFGHCVLRLDAGDGVAG